MALKPSLFPLAFVGARRRTWWLAAALLAIAAIPFGSLWIDWFNVVRHSPGDLAYSLLALPLVLLPLIAWLGRSDRGAERPPSTGTEAS
jgi:predicted DCC family thiol-disulfide oxidoreductase YuxK